MKYYDDLKTTRNSRQVALDKEFTKYGFQVYDCFEDYDREFEAYERSVAEEQAKEQAAREAAEAEEAERATLSKAADELAARLFAQTVAINTMVTSGKVVSRDEWEGWYLDTECLCNLEEELFAGHTGILDTGVLTTAAKSLFEAWYRTFGYWKDGHAVYKQ